MEIWKPIVTDKTDYTGLYEVSQYGDIITVDVVRRGKHHKREIVPTREKGNRLWVSLRDRNGNLNHHCAHWIVARAHNPNPGNKKIILFKDHDWLDIRADNLEWATKYQSDNQPKDTRINMELYEKPMRTGEQMLAEVMAI